MYRMLPRGVLRLSDSLPITRDMVEWQEYRAWLKAGGVPEPMIVEPPPAITLSEIKHQRANAITTDALARIQSVLPDVSNMATAQLVRELWLSIAPAARQPTAKMGQVIAIYQAWGDALQQVKACTAPACVAAVTPAWPA